MVYFSRRRIRARCKNHLVLVNWLTGNSIFLVSLFCNERQQFPSLRWIRVAPRFRFRVFSLFKRMFILLFFSYARFECLERLVITENGIKLGGTKLNGSEEEWWWFIYMCVCVRLIRKWWIFQRLQRHFYLFWRMFFLFPWAIRSCFYFIFCNKVRTWCMLMRRID